MLETPQITHTELQAIAIIRLAVPRSEIRHVMGPGIQELKEAVAAQGVAPTGPWFTHHLKMDPDVFDFEIGVPVPAPVIAAGRMTPSEWPAMKVARTVLHGPYEGLGGAWGDFGAWIKAQGHKPAPDLWERYLAGPDANPDPTTFRTELIRPLME